MVFARSRQLQFGPLTLSGPLLVPSVSSKGFPVRSDGLSETSKILEFAVPDIQDALLVSAYDLHHELIQDSERLLGDEHRHSLFGTPKLLIVDSGGYELNPKEWESGETRRGPYAPLEYGYDNYVAIVDRLPKDRPLLVVSYDDPQQSAGTYVQQRERAQAFFGTRSHLLSTFLLKPEPGDGAINLATLTGDIANVRIFNVIGVTEKDLGDDLLTRLKNLAGLRQLLDATGQQSKPIHVFGSLDPLWTPLYFLCGAEIFDGLSWMRYAYYGGLALHPDELAVLTTRLDAPQQRRHELRFLSNLHELDRMRHSLARWAAEPDNWSHLAPHSDLLQQIYDTVLAELGQES